MGRTTATVTTKQEVRIAPAVQRKLLVELNGYAALHTESKALEAGKKEHGEAVLRLAVKNIDGDKFSLEGYKVAVKRNGTKRSLNVDKLIKRLVKDGKYSVTSAQAVIDDCTDENPVKDHVRITLPGGKDDDNS